MNIFITKAAKCLTGALATAFLTGSVYAACFTVYDGQNKILYQGAKSPVNMSLQLHQTVPVAFPGGSMVFSLDDTGCSEVDTRIDAQASSLNAQTSSNQLTALDGLANRYSGGMAQLTESPSYYNTTSSYGSGHHSGASSRTAGTAVHVSGYTKANGTYVQPHTRAAPGRGRR